MTDMPITNIENCESTGCRCEGGSVEAAAQPAQASPLQGTVPTGLVGWLAGGERGVSSNTIVEHLTGWPANGRWGRSHPYDPADLDRCLQLLRDVPLLRPALPYMASCSPEWAALIARWDEVEASHLEEVGLGWTKARLAPKTYALMHEILDSARATSLPNEANHGR